MKIKYGEIAEIGRGELNDVPCTHLRLTLLVHLNEFYLRYYLIVFTILGNNRRLTIFTTLLRNKSLQMSSQKN